MRKCLLIIIIILSLFIFGKKFNDKNQEIRIRIVSNSNNADDLILKNEVKNTVLNYIDLLYDENYDNLCYNITNTLEELSVDLNNQFNNVSVTFDYHTLYNKAYNNSAIENKKTKVLYIIIGNGNGDNWWGSIYPEFINGSSEICYESILVNVFNKLKEK